MKIGDKVRDKYLARMNNLKSDVFTIVDFGEKNGRELVDLEAETPNEFGDTGFWEYISELDELITATI